MAKKKKLASHMIEMVFVMNHILERIEFQEAHIQELQNRIEMIDDKYHFAIEFILSNIQHEKHRSIMENHTIQ